MTGKPIALLVLALLPHFAAAELRVRVAETDPPSPAELGRDELLSLRLEYAGADNTSLWARPYFAGKPVLRAKTNPSRRHSGDGMALAWFSLDQADRVDEVRIRAGGGSPYREVDVATFPIDVRGTGVAGSGRERAVWVVELLRANDVALRAERATAAAQGTPSGDYLLMLGFGLAVVLLAAGGVILPAWAAWKWRGVWRILALLPLVSMAITIVRVVIDTARDPTSHNLWPFEILIQGVAGVAVVLVLALVRRLVKSRA